MSTSSRLYVSLVCFLIFCGTSFTAVAKPADDGLDTPWIAELDLPDYSYAGYALCPESIEPQDLPVVLVRDHGGVSNDRHSDRDAVIAAIRAAEALGGAAVQFDAGVYLVNEESGGMEAITITGQNIVLRGTTPTEANRQGTVLFMRHHLNPQDPKRMWATPPLFNFTLEPGLNKAPVLTRITAGTPRGGFEVTVEDASRLEVGQYVVLQSQDPAAVPELLAGLKPWDIWTNTINKGVSIRGEKHRITAIKGNRVTFFEPILTDIDPQNRWEVTPAPMAKGWVVEDITFRGDCPEPFVHHKNAAHDSGWTMLGFFRGYAPVVRRCRFIDVSTSVSFSACYGATAIHCTIAGRRGHNAIISGYFSRGTLIAFCKDLTREGSFHGFAASHGAVGTVIYRSINSKRGLDWHGSGPYATLVDACRGGLIGNGGSYLNLPNHLQDLTLWNYRQTHGTVFTNYDWWEPRRSEERYSGAKVVLPRIVGYHGKPTTFLAENCFAVVSHGRPVKPGSLFEAQLLRRLGTLPEWIAEAGH